MNKIINKIIPILISLIIIGGGAFYGGMKYGQNKNPLTGFFRQSSQGLSSEQNHQLFQGNIGESFREGFRRRTGSEFLSGEVIARDEQSLTLKILNGGSKIIFFSDSTQISKTTDGLINDIEIGKQIMVTGEQNTDGSYTARTIQLSFRELAPRNNE